MGREIRRVPKDWKHPRKNDPLYYPGTRDGGYHPLHDMDYETAAAEWVKNFELWQRGNTLTNILITSGIGIMLARPRYWNFTAAKSMPHYFNPNLRAIKSMRL